MSLNTDPYSKKESCTDDHPEDHNQNESHVQ